jgi:Tol biopolymer transport system component
VGWNDGARFRPNHPDTILFVSSRDHPHSIGGDGGGIGQELYAMRADGSAATRLTTSDGFATNYHPNFSHDGTRVVWGNTEYRTWDVMVADFVDDAKGMRLENPRRLLKDTTWWETHDFTSDGKRVITTNTRSGLESTDIYAVDVETGALTRLTDDPAWDEHAHLSPDGRVMSWISGRWHPASVWRFADGSLDATYDFFWIVPGIFFNFINPPVGFSTELTLMNNDGTGITELTTDGQVCADNQWSADSTRILFRQSPADLGTPTRIRMLTFDDCR